MAGVNVKSLLPSLLLTSVSVVMLFLEPVGFSRADLFPSCLVYHFFHANIWHLACNLIALFAFRPRWKTLGVAYLASTLAALVPGVAMSEMTCGMSAILYASFARRYASWKKNPLPLLVSNLVFIFVPCVNWMVHLVSFLIAYSVWLLSRRN